MLHAENDILAKDLMSLKQMREEEKQINEMKKNYENETVSE
jgi:hypothetical protein